MPPDPCDDHRARYRVGGTVSTTGARRRGKRLAPFDVPAHCIGRPTGWATPDALRITVVSVPGSRRTASADPRRVSRAPQQRAVLIEGGLGWVGPVQREVPGVLRIGVVSPVVEHAVDAGRVRGLVASGQLALKSEFRIWAALMIVHGITSVGRRRLRHDPPRSPQSHRGTNPGVSAEHLSASVTYGPRPRCPAQGRRSFRRGWPDTGSPSGTGPIRTCRIPARAFPRARSSSARPGHPARRWFRSTSSGAGLGGWRY